MFLLIYQKYNVSSNGKKPKTLLYLCTYPNNIPVPLETFCQACCWAQQPIKRIILKPSNFFWLFWIRTKVYKYFDTVKNDKRLVSKWYWLLAKALCTLKKEKKKSILNFLACFCNFWPKTICSWMCSGQIWKVIRNNFG